MKAPLASDAYTSNLACVRTVQPVRRKLPSGGVSHVPGLTIRDGSRDTFPSLREGLRRQVVRRALGSGWPQQHNSRSSTQDRRRETHTSMGASFMPSRALAGCPVSAPPAGRLPAPGRDDALAWQAVYPGTASGSRGPAQVQPVLCHLHSPPKCRIWSDVLIPARRGGC